MESTQGDLIRMFQGGDAVRILGLGDSLTYGWEVRRGFFDLFVDRLEKRFEQTPLERKNAGIPGDTAAGGVSRMNSLLSFEPKLSVVQFGLNDCFGGVSLRSFTGSLTRLVHGLAAAGSLVILATSCSLEHLDEAERVDGYYRAIESVAEDTGALCAAVHTYWHREVGVDESLFGYDGVHPTDAGHALMAAGVLELFGK